MLAEGGGVELAEQQSVSSLAADDVPGFAHIFQAHSDVSCLPHQQNFVVFCLCDSWTRVQSEPGPKLDLVILANLICDQIERFQNRNSCLGCAHTSVFVRNRVTKTSQKAFF